MIRHNILFKAKSSLSSAEIDAAISFFCSFEKKLPDVFSIIGGECQFHDEKSQHFFMHELAHGASHCISIDFTDRQAVINFFDNANLIEAKQRIVHIAEGGYAGIIAFDLENPGI